MSADTKYRVLTEQGNQLVARFRQLGQDFIDTLPKSTREYALAQTKMEEAVFWANKATSLEFEKKEFPDIDR